jgi:hypothetical protein
MRYFAVAISPLNEAEQKSFLQFIEQHRMGWWYWITNFWLLIDPFDKIEVQHIRDHLLALPGGKRCIVIDVTKEDRPWSGFAPTAEAEQMFKWIHTNWKSYKT